MFSRTIDRVLSNLVIDPCVRSGRVPGKGAFKEWFGRLAQARIIRVSAAHPLHCILSRDDWITSYSISSHTLMWLWNYVKRSKPSSILELGSGMSTLVFATYASTQSEASTPKILSFDHDEDWLQQTAERLKQLNLEQYVELRNAKICPLELSEPFHQVQGYGIDTDEVVDLIGSPDVVLIDGPPSTIGRIGTFPSLVPAICKCATVFLDDASREPEQSAIQQWCDYFNEKLTHHCTYPLGNGLARMTFNPDTKNN